MHSNKYLSVFVKRKANVNIIAIELSIEKKIPIAEGADVFIFSLLFSASYFVFRPSKANSKCIICFYWFGVEHMTHNSTWGIAHKVTKIDYLMNTRRTHIVPLAFFRMKISFCPYIFVKGRTNHWKWYVRFRRALSYLLFFANTLYDNHHHSQLWRKKKFIFFGSNFTIHSIKAKCKVLSYASVVCECS